MGDRTDVNKIITDVTQSETAYVLALSTWQKMSRHPRQEMITVAKTAGPLAKVDVS